ncbi:hypothetical protein QBC37DRAFT_384993 [Rhypophila decipiens]|uniref:Uncharacterized protein n=1 Tax=Rhypophila decipiens TaxID=261697 RepID=A0AAN6YFV9_9PEZI|nr:hypothetical protein QBC37DRAFT_384993 [Rhypophila decipiens]
MASTTDPQPAAMLAETPPLFNPNRLHGPIKGLNYLGNEVPTEISAMIWESLLDEGVRSSLAGLAMLSCTCRQLQQRVEPLLYQRGGKMIEEELRKKLKKELNQELIREGDDSDLAPILWGAKRGSLATVNKAIKYGADVDASYGLDTDLGLQSESAAPIHWAVVAGHNEVVESLLRAGASLGNGSFYQSAAARKIFYWHLLRLAVTASRGNAETVRQLLGMGVPVNSIEGTGNAALSIPIHQGRWKMASTLLELGAGFETGYPTYPAHKISKATFEHGPSYYYEKRSVIVMALLREPPTVQASGPDAVLQWRTEQEDFIRQLVTKRGLNPNHYFEGGGGTYATPLYHCMMGLSHCKPAMRKLAALLFELGADPEDQRDMAGDDRVWQAAQDPSFWWDQDEMANKGISKAYSSFCSERMGAYSSTRHLLAFIKVQNELDDREIQP